MCCYFRLSLLSELSSFFANLPPPSPEDLVNDTALIPLHGTASRGLGIFLFAIKSLTTSDSFNLSTTDWPGPDEGVLEAVVVAKMYDTPVVYRLLLNGISPSYSPRMAPYLHFAIWAIIDDPVQIEKAALTTTEADSGDISKVSRYIIDFCKIHAPLHWLQLLEYHMRRQQAPSQFLERLHDIWGCRTVRNAIVHQIGMDLYDDCREPGLKGAEDIRQRLGGVKTLKDISAIMEGNPYGLIDCQWCGHDAEEEYGKLFEWVDDFTSYIYDYDD